jgi:hypothetical protein
MLKTHESKNMMAKEEREGFAGAEQVHQAFAQKLRKSVRTVAQAGRLRWR